MSLSIHVYITVKDTQKLGHIIVTDIYISLKGTAHPKNENAVIIYSPNP